VEAVVAVLGVLKAGGAWLPLDPAHPPARLGFVLADAGVGVLVSRQQLLDRLPGQALEGVPVVCLDSDYHQIAAQPDHDPAVNTSPDQLAYVIYTSGSTGKPKGVMGLHRGMVNCLEWLWQTYPFEPGEVAAQRASLGFVDSIWETFAPLLGGVPVAVAADDVVKDPERLVAFLAEHRVTRLVVVPSLLRVLLQSDLDLERRLSTLRYCFSSGEALPIDLYRRFSERLPDAVLVNVYGTSEVSADATYHDTRQNGTLPCVPIGRPIAGTQVYLLDAHMQPVPVGVPGELYVGGVGLARGYLNRPQLTSERFVANPFSDDPQARLYKTGDLGRHLPDGSIEYLGRLDHQVKLRGFRIEPGEIEAVLAEHPRVREAAVIARDDGQDRRLVAYVVPADKGEPIAATLRKHVKATLPEYMAPSTFVTLDALPLTATGKIDRLALPDPSSVDAERAQRPFVAPRTPIEQALAEIFSAALGIERVGADDDFFELGGHSLGVIELLAKIRDRFQLEFPMRVLYETSTVASLAAAIESIRHSGMASAPTALNAVADFEREAVLDPDIRPADALPYTPTSDPAHVFLTGATGFLGVHLLYELLEQTGATIYCLVRAPDVEKGKLRIKEKMTSNRLWQQRYAARIVPVLGDLTKPRFGLSEQRFDELARMVDSVYHSGAYVNFVFPYSALRSTNVFGTHEAIRLASQGKLKPLHHISLTDVALRQDSDGRWVIDEEPATEYPRGIFMSGYAQTKWVAEKLVSIAQSRGLPVTIYRPGFIEGHSQTGFCNTSSELCLTLKGCIDLGMAPDHDMNFDVAPVDYASKAFVYLSRRPELFGRIFNAVNPNPVPLRKVTGWIDAAGYPLQRVPFEQWRRKVIDVVSGNPDHPLYPLLPYSVDEEIARMPLAFPTDCSNTLRGLEGSGISCAKIEPRLLQVCLDHLAEVGFLEPPQTRSPEPEPAMG
jgi:amino acid adenylation domain-containing protein/thioester reductase-like protein